MNRRAAVPQAPPRIFTPDYYERMRELEKKSWWNAGMRDKAGLLLERAALPRTGVLLDAGCGSGQTISWFLENHPNWVASGVDVAFDGLPYARSRRLSVQRASVLAMPVRDGTIDLVISLDVLQHLPLGDGDAIALAEMARVLRPSGTLLVRVNAQSFPRVKDDPEFSFRKYDPATLRGRLESAGFRVLILGRVNALAGVAEIPRELRAAREGASGYHGILAKPTEGGLASRLKRAWLRLEGQALASGWQLPLGRTIFALCRTA